MAEDLEDDLRVADAGLMLCGSKNVFPKSRRQQVKTHLALGAKTVQSQDLQALRAFSSAPFLLWEQPDLI